MSKKNQAIECLRAVAASMVPVMHALNVTDAYYGADTWAAWTRDVRQFGNFGVDLFFLLSGLLIARQIQSRTAPIDFLFRRTARIYPIYWLSLAAILCMPFANWIGTENWREVLHNTPAIMLLAEPGAVHPAAWTLVQEMHFYLVAFVALAAGRFGLMVLVAWAIGQLMMVLSGNSYVFFQPISMELALGLVVGYLPSVKRSLALPLVVTAAGVALAASLLIGNVAVGGWERVLVWGPCAATVAWVCASVSIQAPKPALFLGKISYSIYIWHLPVMMAVFLITRQYLDLATGAIVFLPISLVATIVVSALSFRFIETPVNDAAKAPFIRKPVRAAAS